ncbi:MAG TPA: multicopper oxidase family protein [Stellaceae bacterium]|nr:multicopper oxidase family protein [Stellaceae bacterium]
MSITRRELLLGGAAAALIAPGARAQSPRRLVAHKRTLEVKGKAAPVLGLSLDRADFVVGGRFALTLENRLQEPTLVHWHGLTPPSAQDGTPDLSQPALPPGQSYDYDFELTRAGTYWMHSHVGFQRSKLMAAPLIVGVTEDVDVDEQQVVLFLIDFSFRAPEAIFADLTHGGMAGMSHGSMAGMGHGSMAGMGHGSMAGMDHGGMAGMDHMHMDHGAMEHMHHDMPMAMDINDIDFDAYLANDRTLDDPEVVRVSNQHVRLRIINGSSATNFWIDLGGLTGELIAVDGDDVVPVKGKRFPIAMAQRLDLRLAIAEPGAFPILALREGDRQRTGIILANGNAKIAKIAPLGEATKPITPALEGQLKAARPLAPRKPDRTLLAELTGDMMSFQWGINGKRYGEDTPFRAAKGERVELVMRNRTSMAHPMHLHGHHFQVVAIGDRRFPGAMRDTVLVPAMGSVAVAFDADNPGKWAFHCHNEYHMMAGMMTSLQYEG